jgi:hypothetical protein
MFFSELLLDYYSIKSSSREELARLSAYMRLYMYVCTLNVWAWQRERERESFSRCLLDEWDLRGDERSV